MFFFAKKDLKRSYEWHTREDDPTLRGEPDSSLFARRQGWEVLYLANKLAGKKGYTGMRSLHKLEDMIADGLPSDVRSQEKVYKWIEDNW